MRSRNLKPGYFRNELLAACEPLARLLFAGLWGEADREGRLEDRPQRLKADILPYDPCDIDALLTQLMQRGFITRYVVDGNRYIAIHHFRKHQHPHCKEPPSDIPPPNPHAHAVPSQAPVEHHASTGQAPDEHQCDPADSLLPLTDSLLLIPDSRLTPSPASAAPSRGLRAASKNASRLTMTNGYHVNGQSEPMAVQMPAAPGSATDRAFGASPLTTLQARAAKAATRDRRIRGGHAATGPPVKAVVALYNELLPELQRCEVVTKTRAALIRQRTAEHLHDIDHWRHYFEHVRRCSFLMGHEPPGLGRTTPFRATLEWLVKPGNFAKVAEGNYGD